MKLDDKIPSTGCLARACQSHAGVASGGLLLRHHVFDIRELGWEAVGDRREQAR